MVGTERLWNPEDDVINGGSRPYQGPMKSKCRGSAVLLRMQPRGKWLPQRYRLSGNERGCGRGRDRGRAWAAGGTRERGFCCPQTAVWKEQSRSCA